VDEREGEGEEPGREQRLEPPATPAERRAERNRRRARDPRGQPPHPSGRVVDRVDPERVQVVVVRVVERREDAERRVELLHAHPGPDLVEPEVGRETGHTQRAADEQRERAADERRARREVGAILQAAQHTPPPSSMR
jgi:hypothetical protein